MKSDCLEFADIPHSGRLFLDYLARSGSAMRFYGSFAPLDAPIVEHTAQHRARIAGILERQNRASGASPKTVENIARLREGANAIVTGQQAGLFGGPLLAMLKTLTAIRLAEQHGAVPIFWIASTDHDLAEVDHVDVISGGELRRIAAKLEAQPGAMVSGAKVKGLAEDLTDGHGPGAEPGNASLVDEVAAMFPQGDAEVVETLRGAYGNGERMGIAFAKLWAWLFGRFGLVLIDPDDAELQRLAAPVYARAANEAIPLNQGLLRRTHELDEAGYHDQVKVTEETSLLFVDVEGGRTPVRMVRPLTGGIEFHAGAQHWRSPQELAAEVEREPERFTPNALLRPVVQDHLLPTIAYVGGPAEIAYFAQATVLYDALLGGRTPVIARMSATVVEPRIAEIMERYGMSLAELLQRRSQEELARELSRRVLPTTVAKTFSSSRAALEEQMKRLEGVLLEFDETLAKAAETSLSKMRYQLSKLEERSAGAQLKRQSQIERHAAVLWNNLHPRGELQERVVGGVQYLLKYGPGMVEVLERELQMCGGHQVIRL